MNPVTKSVQSKCMTTSHKSCCPLWVVPYFFTSFPPLESSSSRFRSIIETSFEGGEKKKTRSTRQCSVVRCIILCLLWAVKIHSSFIHFFFLCSALSIPYSMIRNLISCYLSKPHTRCFSNHSVLTNAPREWERCSHCLSFCYYYTFNLPNIAVTIEITEEEFHRFFFLGKTKTIQGRRLDKG